ncbi:uncharacterized protein LOC130963350 [Arachis stenosperma]|uniref:uncharacterized protein LOC130963350 n=1 Tax=Arachis stenosperma TaxID=217475 RepID=UPI0025ABFEB5|nr:uncharacterized protein LOC130963350 [Arachis stenosperma]
MEPDHLKYVGRYKEFGNGCNWMIRVALRQQGSDAAVTIKVLQETTDSTYGFRPSYRKVWKAKQKAVAHIFRDWEVSYAELPRWILGMQATMDGSIALLKTSPVRVGGEVDEFTEYFHRFFWTFPSCVEAFKHCKPLISIDGMHLYEKYGETLLLAIAQDGNSNILSVAFALVEGENAESRDFFLSHLHQHVIPQEGILVIPDRHNGIKAALEAPDNGWKSPHAYQAYCIRHVAANFALSFKGQDAMRMLINAAYAKIEAEFDYWFDIMRTENPAMCDWANRLGDTESTGNYTCQIHIWKVSRGFCRPRADSRGAVGIRPTVLLGPGQGDRAQPERCEVLHSYSVRQTSV